MRRYRHRKSSRPTIEGCETRRLLATDVLTWHNDLAHTGANTTETQLTPANVNQTTFGKLRSLELDGQAYAQPLYVSGLQFTDEGGQTITRNMVYVATQNNTVYAYDVDRGELVWHVAVYNKKMNDTPVPAADTGSTDITPQIGITSTPVIDRSTNTIYVVSKIRRDEGGGNMIYAQRLWALDLVSGAKKNGGKVIIHATVPGTGNAAVNNEIQFNAKIELQRTALLLHDGVVYIAWASHGDQGPYHGWLIGYDAANVKEQVAVWNVTPDGHAGGIWMTGAAPSVDEQGNMFLVTGNGTFTGDVGGEDFGESIVKIPTGGPGGPGGAMAPADSFTAFNREALDAADFDLGSTGVLLLPEQPGAMHPREALFGSKEGKLYLVDRDDLGGFNSGFDDVIQTIEPNGRDGIFMSPVFFNGEVFYSSVNGTLASLAVQPDGTLTATGRETARTFGYPGVNPSISADGTANGIIWVTTFHGDDDRHAVLLAYDPSALGDPLYTSDDAPAARDAATGEYVKFTSPTIADGKVIIGTAGELVVYGLLASG